MIICATLHRSVLCFLGEAALREPDGGYGGGLMSSYWPVPVSRGGRYAIIVLVKTLLDFGDKIASIVGAIAGIASLVLAMVNFKWERRFATSSEGREGSDSSGQDLTRSATGETYLTSGSNAPKVIYLCLWIVSIALTLAWYEVVLHGFGEWSVKFATTCAVALMIVCGGVIGDLIYNRRFWGIPLIIFSFAGGCIAPICLASSVLFDSDMYLGFI